MVARIHQGNKLKGRKIDVVRRMILIPTNLLVISTCFPFHVDSQFFQVSIFDNSSFDVLSKIR